MLVTKFRVKRAEARRESGMREREREESRGSDSRRERSEVSGAHHKTTIIRVRAGNRDASPSPTRFAIIEIFAFREGSRRRDGETRQTVFFVDSQVISLSRDLYHRWGFFFFFYIVGDRRKFDPVHPRRRRSLYKVFSVSINQGHLVEVEDKNSSWR